MARARLEVKFEYRESANHVYKTAKYSLNGKPVTARKREIQKLLQDAPDIIRASTFFWKPAPFSVQRRAKEQRIKEQIMKWLEGHGFKTKTDPYNECLVIGVKEVEEMERGRQMVDFVH